MVVWLPWPDYLPWPEAWAYARLHGSHEPSTSLCWAIRLSLHLAQQQSCFRFLSLRVYLCVPVVMPEAKWKEEKRRGNQNHVTRESGGRDVYQGQGALANTKSTTGKGEGRGRKEEKMAGQVPLDCLPILVTG